MNFSSNPTHRPFAFSVFEDDGENVTIEISEEDYKADPGILGRAPQVFQRAGNGQLLADE